MIDFEKLNHAYYDRAFYSLQLEIGDVCHQGCIYCYMNALDNPVNTLSDQQIRNILNDAYKLNITAVEWLGGEPLLRDSIFEHMKLCADLGMKNNVWTGGLPFEDDYILENTAKYAMNGLIAVHISSIDPRTYQQLHPGHSGAELEMMLNKIQKLIDLGYPSSQMLNSVTFTGLQSVHDMIKTIDYFENKFDIKTSLNVYHTYLRPGISRTELEKFIPSSKDIKTVYARYLAQWGGENMPMNCVNKQYCSATLAVLCEGSVTPCATIRPKSAPAIHGDDSFYDIVNANRYDLIFGKFREAENLPVTCQNCKLSEICFGCRSRAYAAGNGLYGMDPRCFRV